MNALAKLADLIKAGVPVDEAYIAVFGAAAWDAFTADLYESLRSKTIKH